METLTTEEFCNLTSEQLLFKMDELRHLASELGCQWAEANHAYRAIEKQLPSILAEIQLIYIESGNKTQEAKVKALADTRYRQKMQEFVNLERTAELIKVEYRALVESLKTLQSIGYVKNSELRLSR